MALAKTRLEKLALEVSSGTMRLNSYSVMPIGRTTSMIAELAALRRGLELVLENGWSNVWLEGDSKSLVDIILKSKIVRCKEAQRQVSCINLISPELKNCLATHVFREGNKS
ncbi:hypothetical protein Peur_024315 [Populus x canadensis]